MFVDAFGNAIGNSIIRHASEPPKAKEASTKSNKALNNANTQKAKSVDEQQEWLITRFRGDDNLSNHEKAVLAATGEYLDPEKYGDAANIHNQLVDKKINLLTLKDALRGGENRDSGLTSDGAFSHDYSSSQELDKIITSQLYLGLNGDENYIHLMDLE